VRESGRVSARRSMSIPTVLEHAEARAVAEILRAEIHARHVERTSLHRRLTNERSAWRECVGECVGEWVSQGERTTVEIKRTNKNRKAVGDIAVCIRSV